MILNDKKNKIDTDIEIGEIVYLITDNEQKDRMVTSFTVSALGTTYSLSQGIDSSNHYRIEISKCKSYKFN